VIARSLAATFVALVLAGSALASEEKPTLAELESELYCPTCQQLLALSNAPIADRIRAFVSARIAAGDGKSEIKEKLVAEFGEGVLAAPPARGFNLLVWVLPIAGALLSLVVLGVLARRWTQRRAPPASSDSAPSARAPLDPDLEHRIDEELARLEL
jgi:cytochrome c-type biogenesis protein CcmH